MTTSELRLGSGVCLVTQRDPIVTAKEVASLDLISGGRVEFGVGAGWNREELRNHGTDPRERMALWPSASRRSRRSGPSARPPTAARMCASTGSGPGPSPSRTRTRRVWVGGNGPTVEDRVLSFGDGWIPNVIDDDELLGRIAALRSRAGYEVPVSINASPRRPERIERYAEAGVERAIFYLPSSSRDEIERRMDAVQDSWAQLWTR